MGRGLSGLASGMGWIAAGMSRAIVAVKKFKPDVVIGFGGYAGFCPVAAACLLGIPAAVHEQNSVPGVTNRLLGRMVKRVFLSFPDTMGAFPTAKAILTGNPVRSTIIEAAGRRMDRLPGKRVLVLGGSQGSRPINDAVIQALPELMKNGVELVHQAGRLDFKRVRASYETTGANPEQVKEFIEDMGTEYANCDLAICRAGATTVFEIAATGVPAIFVPFPQATHDHQTKNAKAMSEIGAARLIPQEFLNGNRLAASALELLEAPELLTDMGNAARGFAKKGAAAEIAAGLERLAAQGRGDK